MRCLGVAGAAGGAAGAGVAAAGWLGGLFLYAPDHAEGYSESYRIPLFGDEAQLARVAAGEADLRYELLPGKKVTGRISWGEGRPAVGLPVLLYGNISFGGGSARFGIEPRSTRTGADGSFDVEECVAQVRGPFEIEVIRCFLHGHSHGIEMLGRFASKECAGLIDLGQVLGFTNVPASACLEREFSLIDARQVVGREVCVRTEGDRLVEVLDETIFETIQRQHCGQENHNGRRCPE